MELGFFTGKPQSLVLTSLSSPSLDSTNLCFLQREPFGWGHGSRPPGRGGGGSLRFPRKCRRQGIFRLQSRSFGFRASFQPQSVLVVVAVVTLSAVSVVYYLNQRRRRNVKEVARRRIHAHEDFQQDSFSELGETLLDDTSKEAGGQARDEGSLWESQESAFVHEEASVTRALEFSGPDIVASSVSESTVSNHVAVAETTFPSSFSESAAPALPAMAGESSGFNTNGFGEVTGIDSGMPPLFGSSSLHFDHVLLEEKENNTVNEPGREMEITSNSAIYRESMRQGLYTFYEARQPLTISAPKLNSMGAVSAGESILDTKRFSSLVRDAILNGVEPQDGDSLQSSGTAAVKGKVVPRGKQRKHLNKSGFSDLSRHFQPNGTPVNYKHQPTDKFTAYNRLVKDGRLSDCVKVLQNMEKEGILDMDKIYHARFFETCKRHKAVKEALNFTKLIPNPTLSTFNMLMSVCSSSQDAEGAFEVLLLAQEAGLKADCKLYTTLISTCAKSGKVDTMFKVYHEMVNAGVEPNVHTYGALIDGCARAGQVAKAFGAYGIMRSKNVKPDRVVFNALISACGQSGAVDRAFDVLAEMRAETQPIDPDHITVGALIKACANAGQVDRARQVYKMMREYNIKGSPDVYTITANCCSQTGDWDFACSVYADMRRKGVVPDEIFFSSLIDVAGHAGKIDAAFETLKEATAQGISPGNVLYSSLMGACSNAKNWQKALRLYEDIRSMNLNPTVSTMNALITALCDGNQLQKAMEVLSKMNNLGLCPNSTTYSILMGASERNNDLDAAVMLLSQAKKDGIPPSLVMCRCIIGMCLRRYEEACTLGEPVFPLNSGKPQLDNRWTLLALTIYRETIVGGIIPSIEVVSQVLGCLHLPYNASLKTRLVENLGVFHADVSRRSNLCSLVDGFGEYDPRAFSLFEEAASLGVVPSVSFKESPLVVDVRQLRINTAEVYLLTVLKGLKHRLAAGAKLPNVNILLPTEKAQIQNARGEKTVTLSGRAGQAVAALLRRIGLPFHGNESYGKIRINGLALKRWFQPKLASPFTGEPGELTQVSSSLSRLGKRISSQQRHIRTSDLSLE